MDPLSLAGTFATIVGLLSNFKAERSGAQLEDFMAWLREQHQDGIAQSISQSEKLQTVLSALLSTNHEELVTRLKSITDQLAEVAARVDGFGQLSHFFAPNAAISPQAKSILVQMANSTAKFVMEHPMLSGTEYLLMDGGTGHIQAEEPSFLKEDFEVLAETGHLRVEFTSKGTPRYFLTRKGKQVASDA